MNIVVDHQLDLIVIALWLPAFSEKLGISFSTSSEKEIESEVERLSDYFSATLEALRRNSSAPILWLSLELPPFPSNGIFDATAKCSQRKSIASLNSYLESELRRVGNAWLVDTSVCLERVGANKFYDWRYWYMANSPYSRIALAEIANEIQKHIRSLSGRVRKCLVLDCDNTLWGGIVGEDGLNGICIGTEYPGSAFRDFQLEILNLYSRGVILCLCSKNNEEEVLSVLRTNQHMILREEHFAAFQINWSDKVSNLRRISEQLNIGLDSIVFVDDSDFEINLVRNELPEVVALKVSASKPYDHRYQLIQGGWFDTHHITDEDLMRSQMYRAEFTRKQILSATTDMKEYLKSLEMRLGFESVTESSLERVAQLCQRTNQFNLTTKRYSLDELASFVESPSSRVFMLRLSDKHGDYGIIGLCIIFIDHTIANIDSFMMSCRALGRGVESAFLSLCVQSVATDGAKTITSKYIPTSKNVQVSSFYDSHGFTVVSKNDGDVCFSLKWSPGCIGIPTHFSDVSMV